MTYPGWLDLNAVWLCPRGVLFHWLRAARMGFEISWRRWRLQSVTKTDEERAHHALNSHRGPVWDGQRRSGWFTGGRAAACFEAAFPGGCMPRCLPHGLLPWRLCLLLVALIFSDRKWAGDLNSGGKQPMRWLRPDVDCGALRPAGLPVEFSHRRGDGQPSAVGGVPNLMRAVNLRETFSSAMFASLNALLLGITTVGAVS